MVPCGLMGSVPDFSPGAPAVRPLPKTVHFLPGVERIKERKKLRVAQYRGECPLFFMLVPKGYVPPEAATHPLPGGGRIMGTDVAIAKMIAKELGVELELLRDYVSYEDVVSAVSAGEADLGISDLTPTFSRQQIVLFSDPYVSFSLAVLCNREKIVQKDIRTEPRPTFDSFCSTFNNPSLTIAVEGETSLHEQAKKMFPNANVKGYPDFKTALKDVRDGNADLFLSTDFDFLFVKLFDPELGFYCSMLRIPDLKDPVCVAVSPACGDILGLVNEAVKFYTFGDAADTIRKYGRFLKSMEKARREDSSASGDRSYPFDAGYFGNEPTTAAIAWRGIFSSAGIAFPLVFFLVVWVRMSKGRKRGNP